MDTTKMITMEQIFGNLSPAVEEVKEEKAMEIEMVIDKKKEEKIKIKSAFDESSEEEPPSTEVDFHKQFLEALKAKQQTDDSAKDQAQKDEEERLAKIADDKKKRIGEICEESDPEEYIKGTIEEEGGSDYFAKQRKMAERKEIKKIDHLSLSYIPFRKNLYMETQEVSNLTPYEVQDLRSSLGKITIRGRNCPNPISNWYQCGLSDKLLHTLMKRKKFEGPFPIQAQALPAIMSGRDVIGIAETGSGKTLAFLLPMLRHIKD